MKWRRKSLDRLALLAVCILLLPLAWPGVGARLGAWITPFGGHLVLALLIFAAGLFALNRVLSGLYQEFINRE